jgi:hypothetical protein
MATYTQEAKRLVLVAEKYNRVNTAAAPLAVGDVGFMPANGADIATNVQTTAPAAVKFALSTGNKQFGAANSLMLVSETIQKDMVMKVTTKPFEQPKVMTNTIALDTNRTYSQGEELVLSLEFDSYGSVSNKNIYSRYGAYWVPVDGTSAATVAAALVANLNKNVARDQTPRVVAYVGAAGFLASFGANITPVNGAKTLTITTATGNFSGLAVIGGSPYVVTVVSGETIVTLDRPYEGPTSISVAKATVAADTAAATIYIIGQMQSKIDFHNMFNQITWRSALTVDGEAAPVTSAVFTPATIGSGYGPEVALIEEFANNSTNRQQYVELRKQYDQRLQTVASSNYDTINIKIGSTKTGSGSNVTSIREIQIFVKVGATQSAATMVADFNTWRNA